MMVRLAGAALLLLGTAAQAADGEAGDGKAPKPDRLITVGLGAQIVPKYPGADNVLLAPLPRFDIRRVGDPIRFSAPDQGSGLSLLGSHSAVNFGPVFQLQGKRREKDVGAPVGNVGFTVEPGAFIQAWMSSTLRVRAEGRKGIGGHKAWVGDLSADVVVRGGDTTFFSIGPRARLSDARYQRAYFGVTPAVAVRTGLPAYNPGGGVYAVGAVAGLLQQLSPKWGIWAYAGYDRLVRNAGNSPIVRAFGSRDQFSGGVALTYSFTIHRH
jgi:outer membrane protein